MFCTKCGANNEDNNLYCKKCGARLAKPVTNNAKDTVVDSQSVSNNSVSGSPITSNISGVVQAGKSVNTMLIAGLAAVAVVVVLVVGVVFAFSKGGGNKSLFETIEIGKTSLKDLEKYFDKNNLGSSWGDENTMYHIDDGIWLEVPDWRATGWDFERGMLWNSWYEDLNLFERFLLHNDLSDTLWGANCDYFFAMSGNKDDKDRKALFMACVAQVDGNAGEKEFRQQLNEYIKKHQKTKLENKKFTDGEETDFTFYPLEVTTMGGEKVLVCLNCQYGFMKEGYILLALFAEPYYTEKDLEIIMTENVPASDELFWDPDYHVLFNDKEIGWYFSLTLTEMYPEFQEEELKEIAKEAPDFVCSMDSFFEDENLSSEIKGIIINGYNQSGTDDVVIPETIHDYPVKGIADDAFSGCSSLISITIPNSVTSIGNRAFSGCSSLTSINIPNGITRIGNEMFSGCSSLTSITLSNGITNIGSKAFANCTSLTSINIPSSATDIADDAFDGCDNLVSDELSARFPNAVPKPSWFEPYKEFYEDKYGGYLCWFIGADNNGVPYLGITAEYLYWYHYNGTEVEQLPSNRCFDVEYNPETNKALIYDYYPNGYEFCDLYDLYDLYTATEEMRFAYNEDYESGVITYYVNDSEASKDEYDRMWSEMRSRFGEGGYSIETWYNSVDEAYQAYMSNKDNVLASKNTSSANAPTQAEVAQVEEPVSEYILKDSNSRYLTKSDLQGLSADDCRLARNEIYARYGRKFNDEGLQSYFDSCSWYQGTIEPDDFQESMLNDYEIANKNLIVDYEKEMGYR